MTVEPMLRLESVGKRLKRVRADDTLVQSVLRRIRGGEDSRWFWALSDVTIAAAPGETIGIIGANGAGKSTLLKVVAGILRPDTGWVGLRGRVTSLIELGAGFHPELSGRDNIYLNASILGLSPREIDERFDRIVDFAEIPHAIHAPIKQYSTGMQARLGFAVAIHLNPEILLVDEVLSVGDIAFQNKCRSWMRDFRSSGKTIFFVSHDLSAVEILCDRVFWLQNGRVRMSGAPREVIPAYIKDMDRRPGGPAMSSAEARRFGSGEIQFEKIEVVDERGSAITSLNQGDKLRIRAAWRASEPKDDVIFRIRVVAHDTGVGVFAFNTAFDRPGPARLEGRGEVICEVDSTVLEPRTYRINAAIHPAEFFSSYDYIEDAGSFDIAPREALPNRYYAYREAVRLPSKIAIRNL